MQVNLNDKVKVKLTPYGIRVHNDYYHQYTLGATDIPTIKVDEFGYTTFQLWNLMQIFGHNLILGRPALFDKNEIVIEDN